MAIKKKPEAIVEVKEESTVAEAAKKSAVKKAAPVKKASAKTEEKEILSKTEEKPAAKKPAAKKEEPKESVVIQYGANEVVMKDVVAAAVKAYKAAHKGIEIKTVDVYVKPEENAAYYVVNGDDSEGNNKIALF